MEILDWPCLMVNLTVPKLVQKKNIPKISQNFLFHFLIFTSEAKISKIFRFLCLQFTRQPFYQILNDGKDRPRIQLPPHVPIKKLLSFSQNPINLQVRTDLPEQLSRFSCVSFLISFCFLCCKWKYYQRK